MTATTEHFIETPLGRLFARAWTSADRPTKAAIVLLHDSLGCVDLWRTFPATLCTATARQVIAYDRLGFGRSDPRSDQPQPDFVRQEAETYVPCLLRHFQMKRFVAFGHSVGGAMAICCGAVLPAATAAIVTESAQVFAEDKTLQGIAAARVEYARDERFERLKKYHGEKAAWVLQAWTDTWLAPEFASWNVRRELEQLRSPLLALHGDRDEFGSLDHLEVAQRLSGAPVTTHVMQGVGHVPHKEKPDSVVDLVSRFLEGCS